MTNGFRFQEKDKLRRSYKSIVIHMSDMTPWERQKIEKVKLGY